MSEPARHAVPRWLADRASWLIATTGLLAISVLLITTWTTSTPIIDQIAGIERSRLPRLELLQTAKSADLDASVALRNVLLLRDAKLNSHELERYARASRDAVSALSDFRARSSTAEEIQLVDRTLDARSHLEKARFEALEADRIGTTLNADATTTALQAVLDDYLGKLRQLQNHQASLVTALVGDMADRADTVRILLVACGVAAAATMLLLIASWRVELRRQVRQRDLHIASLQMQKTALVGEVHHRIKNHLQGLLGLFETHERAAGLEPVAGSLATLHGHVLALIGIHGLQAKDVGRPIMLKDLVRQQVELARSGFPDAQLALTEGQGLEDATLAPEQAVPVALMVTELLVNAIKHGAPLPIRVGIEGGGGQDTCVTIKNRLTAPTAMDWKSGRGLGTGLGLVVTLLQGVAELLQSTTPEEMIMTLRLPPLTGEA